MEHSKMSRIIHTGPPIRQAIREERMRLDDIEWETGERPDEGWLNFLISEAERGVTIFRNTLIRIEDENDNRSQA